MADFTPRALLHDLTRVWPAVEDFRRRAFDDPKGPWSAEHIAAIDWEGHVLHEHKGGLRRVFCPYEARGRVSVHNHPGHRDTGPSVGDLTTMCGWEAVAFVVSRRYTYWIEASALTPGYYEAKRKPLSSRIDDWWRRTRNDALPRPWGGPECGSAYTALLVEIAKALHLGLYQHDHVTRLTTVLHHGLLPYIDPLTGELVAVA